jgi:DNA mismatch endonuclease (patch repair protein)
MRANRAVSRREVAFRKALWAAGARGYRLHPPLPGKPDLFFPKLGLAICVNGCFWHYCPSCNLPKPKANGEFWARKLAATRARDIAMTRLLEESGIDTIVVWEHDIRPDPRPTAAAVARVVAERREEQRP